MRWLLEKEKNSLVRFLISNKLPPLLFNINYWTLMILLIEILIFVVLVDYSLTSIDLVISPLGNMGLSMALLRKFGDITLFQTKFVDSNTFVSGCRKSPNRLIKLSFTLVVIVIFPSLSTNPAWKMFVVIGEFWFLLCEGPYMTRIFRSKSLLVVVV